MIKLILFLPLLSALFTGLLTKKISARFAQIFTTSLVFITAIIAWLEFLHVKDIDKAIIIDLLRFIDIGGFKANWSIYIDSLTLTMFVVVTTVSSVVHLYSIGYMSHDPHIQRFMSYLSLFTFFMLMLVSASNFMQLFFGWEGVGLCSYLLIGFWYHKESANKAAMKAFIVNRVGDLFFILGIFTVYNVFGSVEFSSIFTDVAKFKDAKISILSIDFNAINLMCVLLFLGAMGKSAQLGLHTWLPDAMEGPTPVSALIHAATMVTAGVFLVARFSPVFEYADHARELVTYVGATTSIFAAIIAVTQFDIKRIIAFSTCSQLGYMFFACGVSAYGPGVFHLMTHAFFKALLFLGAGSVIHAVSDEQDIRAMGGLWKKIPVTYVFMLLGSFALAGIYPFAGYFSKDVILEAAIASGTNHGKFAYYVGIIVAFLTAFYSWRLIIYVFHGKCNLPSAILKKIHESPLVMLIPLFILSLGALFSGKYGVQIGMIDPHNSFWHNAIIMINQPNILHKIENIDSIFKILPSVAGWSGIILSILVYVMIPGFVNFIIHSFKPLYYIIKNKFYIDEIYDFLIVKPASCLGTILWKYIDIQIIDNCGPNGIARLTNKLAMSFSKLQSGYLYHYAFIMILGVVVIISWFVWILIA